MQGGDGCQAGPSESNGRKGNGKHYCRQFRTVNRWNREVGAVQAAVNRQGQLNGSLRLALLRCLCHQLATSIFVKGLNVTVVGLSGHSPSFSVI